MADKKTGRKLKGPRVIRGPLETKFYQRYGRDPHSDAELDAFRTSLSQEERADATAARDARASVVNRVLDHNLRERTYMENRAADKESIMMQRDAKFLRRMIREWKKEQPHAIHTLDRGVEWLPGNLFPNADRKLRFKTKQDAIDFTQQNKPRRPDALIPGGDLESVISTMIEAEKRVRAAEAAEAAAAPVKAEAAEAAAAPVKAEEDEETKKKGTTAADKAGRTGPLYDYKFTRKPGESANDIFKRLDAEVDAAADRQFGEARAARAQRAQQIQARQHSRELAARRQGQPNVTAPTSAPADESRAEFLLGRRHSETAPEARLAPASVSSSQSGLPPSPFGRETPEETAARKARFLEQQNQRRAEREAKRKQAAEEERKRAEEFDAFSKRVEEQSRNDPYYSKNFYGELLKKDWSDLKNGRFGAIWDRFKRGLDFTLREDFGFGKRRRSYGQ